MAAITFVGLLPAAGMGSRLHPLRCPKELLPIAYRADPLTGNIRLMLAAEHSMQAMYEAGIRKCVMIVSDRKAEMLRYFGNGSEAGLSLAYVNQPEPLGLASAIDAAYDWVSDSCVCLALPDTVFSPREALSSITKALEESGADVVLGVFPTQEPRQLGPVRIEAGGRVIEVFEKPESTDLYNTWGVAAWNPKFTDFLHQRAKKLTNLSIGHIFNEAIKEGLSVRAIYFESGSYTDLGTGAKLAAMVFSSNGAA